MSTLETWELLSYIVTVFGFPLAIFAFIIEQRKERENEDEEVYDTLLHEIAHALAGPGAGHGPVWKAICIKIGAKPHRCYGEQVNMPQGRYQATCGGCQRVHHKHRRPRGKYFCKACGRERGQLCFVIKGN